MKFIKSQDWNTVYTAFSEYVIAVRSIEDTQIFVDLGRRTYLSPTCFYSL